MSSTEETFRKIVVDHMGVSAEKVTLDTSLVDDLKLDSLDTVELVMAVEEDFGIEVPDDVAEKCITVRDCIDTIDAALIGDAR